MAINRKTVVGAIDPDVLAFTEGKDPILDLALAQWDCIGTAAHVTMLSRMEVAPAIFSREERNAVVADTSKGSCRNNVTQPPARTIANSARLQRK